MKKKLRRKRAVIKPAGRALEREKENLWSRRQLGEIIKWKRFSKIWKMCEKSQKGKRKCSYYSVLSLASRGPAAFHVLLWFSLVRYYYHCLPDEKKGVRKG